MYHYYNIIKYSIMSFKTFRNNDNLFPSNLNTENKNEKNVDTKSYSKTVN